MRAGAVYYDLSLGYLDEDGIAGRPGFSEATLQYGFNDYISGYTGANATTDYYSTLVGSAFNTYWGALAVDLSRSAAKGREHGWQEGYRWRVSASKSFTSDTRMLLSMSHSSEGNYRSIRDAAWEHDRHPNDWREMTRYSATLSQRAGSGSLSFNGIWVRMYATTAGAHISWAMPAAMVSSIIICMPSRAGISITAIIRWWASPFAAVRAGGQPDHPL